MGKLSPNKILKRVEKEGFESVWKESAQLLPEATRSDVARRYITGRKRKIDVAGPVFIGVREEIAKA